MGSDFVDATSEPIRSLLGLFVQRNQCALGRSLFYGKVKCGLRLLLAAKGNQRFGFLHQQFVVLWCQRYGLLPVV